MSRVGRPAKLICFSVDTIPQKPRRKRGFPHPCRVLYDRVGILTFDCPQLTIALLAKAGNRCSALSAFAAHSETKTPSHPTDSPISPIHPPKSAIQFTFTHLKPNPLPSRAPSAILFIRTSSQCAAPIAACWISAGPPIIVSSDHDAGSARDRAI